MRLSELIAGLPATLVRDADVTGFGALTSAREGVLHYFSDPKFAFQLDALSGPRSVVTTPALQDRVPRDFGLALSDRPREVFLMAYGAHGEALEAPPAFTSIIDPSARIHPSAVIAERNVRIGENVVIGANSVVEERVEIEEGARIGANCVIGGDGFEAGMVDGAQIMLAHYGGVRIGRNVVIQSGCTIDWGLFGVNTEIGDHSALDNLVHVAHNVRIGRNCQITACTMIAGSTVIEDAVRIGPNATVSNGLTIGRGARITIGAVVTRDVEPGGHVTGHFAVPHRQFLLSMRRPKS